MTGAIKPDILDYPTAWAIQREGGLEHHPRCSCVPGWDPISGPSFLCDCGAVIEEWKRLRQAHDGVSPMDVERRVYEMVAENFSQKVTDTDRLISKAVCENKAYLGDRGMIEVALVIARQLASQT